MGNEHSGNIYQAHINPESDLGVFLHKLASAENQGLSMWIIKDILRTHEKEALEFWKEHPERLEFLKKKYGQDIVSRAIENGKKAQTEQTTS
jgi:hypothetical protein